MFRSYSRGVIMLGPSDLKRAPITSPNDPTWPPHAHAGTEYGTTAGGTPVRNVAHPVLRRPYAIYQIADRTPTAP